MAAALTCFSIWKSQTRMSTISLLFHHWSPMFFPSLPSQRYTTGNISRWRLITKHQYSHIWCRWCFLFGEASVVSTKQWWSRSRASFFNTCYSVVRLLSQSPRFCSALTFHTMSRNSKLPPWKWLLWIFQQLI